jgi:hypothetical protein
MMDECEAQLRISAMVVIKPRGKQKPVPIPIGKFPRNSSTAYRERDGRRLTPPRPTAAAATVSSRNRELAGSAGTRCGLEPRQLPLQGSSPAMM